MFNQDKHNSKLHAPLLLPITSHSYGGSTSYDLQDERVSVVSHELNSSDLRTTRQQ